MKNVILIHGFNGVPKIYEWLERELKTRGIKVTTPSFPKGEATAYENWAQTFDDCKSVVTPSSIVVCHSVGNEFIIKYLTANNLPINTYVGLAGFAETFAVEGKGLLNFVVQDFLVSPEERQKFIALSHKRYAIYSDDDHIVPFDILKAYPEAIAAEGILIPNIGHMGHKSGLETLPRLLDLVLKNA